MKIYNWDFDKNQELNLNRGISFEKAVFHIEHGGLLDDIVHPNVTDYPNQRIFILKIENYVYLVPYVESEYEIFSKRLSPAENSPRYILETKHEQT